MSAERPTRIDCLQYCNWSEEIFRQMREGGLDAVHVTICYHELFRETVANIEAWNRLFERHADLIVPGRWAGDVRAARDSGRTAIFFGFQNCSPIEDDIGLVEIVHQRTGVGLQLLQQAQQRGAIEVLHVLDHRGKRSSGVLLALDDVDRHIEIRPRDLGLSRCLDNTEADGYGNGGESPQNERSAASLPTDLWTVRHGAST